MGGRLAIRPRGRGQLYYWRDTKQAEAVLARERPVLEARGTPAQRALFYAHLGHVRARASRYRVDESIVSDFRAAKAAAEELGGRSTVVVPKWRTRVAGPIGILGLPCGGTGTSKPHWWSSVKR